MVIRSRRIYETVIITLLIMIRLWVSEFHYPKREKERDMNKTITPFQQTDEIASDPKNTKRGNVMPKNMSLYAKRCGGKI